MDILPRIRSKQVLRGAAAITISPRNWNWFRAPFASRTQASGAKSYSDHTRQRVGSTAIRVPRSALIHPLLV
jgi:hypothetical protein